MATFTVLNVDDAGPGSLRDALIAANTSQNTTGPDVIEFNIPGDGPHTIQPLTPLPQIDDAVIIDGYSQPGAAENTNPLAQGTNASLRIELDGSLIQSHGLVLTDLSQPSTVAGLVINGFAGAAISIEFSNGHTIRGNFLGTDVSGSEAAPNGVAGVHLVDSSQTTIGGQTPGDRNLISGNTGPGIFVGSLQSFAGSQNLIQSNLIGTASNGLDPLGNGRDGVALVDANGTVIGGTSPDSRNVIAHNNGAGVSIVGFTAVSNSVLGNSIFANQQLPIDLGRDGPTPNDPDDSDQGPNMLQNFPVLTAATSDAMTTTISGSLTSAPNLDYRIEFFSAGSVDDLGQAPAERFLGATDVTIPDGQTTVNFANVSVPVPVPRGHFITATATSANGDTSELSAPVPQQTNHDPVTGDDAFATDEDTALSIDPLVSVLGNDTDVDGDTLTVSNADTVSQLGAAVNVQPDGSFSYDPTNAPLLQAIALGDMLVDTFSYQVDDANGGTATGNVTITVAGVNDAPIAADIVSFAFEDGLAITVAFRGDDVDTDDDPASLSYLLTSLPTEGAVVNNNDGTFRFDPGNGFQDLSAGQTRSVTFTYVAIDRHALIDYGDAPTAAQSGFASSYPTTISDNGAGHVILPGFHLGMFVDGEPDGTPSLNALGDDENTTVNDEDGVTINAATIFPGSAAGEMTVSVMTGGHLPGRVNAWIDFNRDGDWDDPGEQIVTDFLVGDGDHVFTFPVPANAVSGDTYVRVRYGYGRNLRPTGPDIAGEVEDHQVRILSQNPQALDDQFTITQGAGPTTFPVLDNDIQSLSPPLTVLAAGSSAGVGVTAAGGQVSPSANGTGVVYTPPLNFFGDDSFSYTIRDGAGNTDSADVSVRILPSLVLAVDDSFTVPANSSGNQLPILRNDLTGQSLPIRIESLGNPLLGSVVIDNRGTADPGDDTLVYTPSAGIRGTDQFTYTIQDSVGVTSTATVTVHVDDSDDDEVRIRLQATDLDGNPIQAIGVGEEFNLQVRVADDLRADDEDGDDSVDRFGVAAAYLDILYNFSLVSLSSRQPFFGADFQNATSISTSTPGLIDEAGAFQTNQNMPLGRTCQIEIANATCSPEDNEFLLLTIPMRAMATGVANFVGDPADRRTNGPFTPPDHDVLIFTPPQAVLLDQIRYENDSLTIMPSSASTLQGTATSASGTVTITVVGVNDAPVLDNDLSPSFAPVRVDDVNNSGLLVSSLLTESGDLISDVDEDAVEGIAIVATSGSGNWEFSVADGSTFSPFGSFSETNALLLRDTDLIRYRPPTTAIAGSPDMASITFRAWDQTSDDPDTTQNGGTTAFSATTIAATAHVAFTLGELRANADDAAMNDLVITDGVQGGKADRLQISLDATGTQLVITDNSYLVGDFTGTATAANSVQIPISRITSGIVEFNLGDGDNTLDIDFSNAPVQGVNLSLVINGGADEDQLSFMNAVSLGSGGISMNDQVEDIFVLGPITTSDASVMLNAVRSIEINANIVTNGTVGNGQVQITTGHDILGLDCAVIDAGDAPVSLMGTTGIANVRVQTSSSVSLTSISGGISGCDGGITVQANSLTLNAEASAGGALLVNRMLSIIAPMQVDINELHGSVGGLGIFLTNPRELAIDNALATGLIPVGQKVISIVPLSIAAQAEGETSPWQNQRNPLDVNDDSFVSPSDALAAINYLTGATTAGSGESSSLTPAMLYLDVNGDRAISAIDVLQVINYLNATEATFAEGESATDGASGQSQLFIPTSTELSSDDLFSPRSDRQAAFRRAETSTTLETTSPAHATLANSMLPRIPYDEQTSSLSEFSRTDLDAVLDDLSPDVAEHWHILRNALLECGDLSPL